MQRPTSVIVLGVLNVFFGVLGLFATGLTLVAFYAQSYETMKGISSLWIAWSKVNTGLGLISSILLTAAGIGLLSNRAWGRQLSIGWSIFSLGLTVLGLGLNGYFLWSMIQEFENGPDTVPALIGGLIGSVVSLIYPTLLWFFMTRVDVKRHFGVVLSGESSESLAGNEFGPIAGTSFPSVSSPISSDNPYSSPITASAPTASLSGTVPHRDSAIETLIPARNGSALLAYYMGIFSFFPLLGLPLAVAAIYFGIRGLGNVRRDPSVKGTVHAWIGVICGTLFGLGNLLAWIGVIVAIVSASIR